VQRIFKHGDIKNAYLSPDEGLKILIYGVPSCVNIYNSYKLLRMVAFLAHALLTALESLMQTTRSGQVTLTEFVNNNKATELHSYCPSACKIFTQTAGYLSHPQHLQLVFLCYCTSAMFDMSVMNLNKPTITTSR